MRRIKDGTAVFSGIFRPFEIVFRVYGVALYFRLLLRPIQQYCRQVAGSVQGPKMLNRAHHDLLYRDEARVK